jgi:hypothetical protein
MWYFHQICPFLHRLISYMTDIQNGRISVTSFKFMFIKSSESRIASFRTNFQFLTKFLSVVSWNNWHSMHRLVLYLTNILFIFLVMAMLICGRRSEMRIHVMNKFIYSLIKKSKIICLWWKCQRNFKFRNVRQVLLGSRETQHCTPIQFEICLPPCKNTLTNLWSNGQTAFRLKSLRT